MNLVKISWKNISAKPLSTALNLILFSFGVSIISLLLILNHQVEDTLEKNQAGIGLVVGAKGSPMQLILSSIYHLDVPTGNIKLAEANKLKRHPLISKTIPLALGDNYKGFRVVGTDHQYTEQYEAEVAEGRLWEKNLEVTIGSKIADKVGLKIGDKFAGAHGMVAGGHSHDNQKFNVVGILKPTGSVIDQLILTNIGSVWDIHADHGKKSSYQISLEPKEKKKHHDDEGHKHGDEEHHHDKNDGHKHGDEEHHHDENDGHKHGDEEHHHDENEGHKHGDEEHHHDKNEGHKHGDEEHHHDENEGHKHGDEEHHHEHSEEEKEITAMLIKFRNPMGAITLPRMINEKTNMQAASPAFETARLFDLIGVGANALKVFAGVIIFISGLSVFISLYSSLKERRYEIAYLRVLGATKQQLFVLIILEGVIIALLGYILGLAFSHIGMSVLGIYLEDAWKFSFSAWDMQTEEVYLFFGAIIIGIVSSIIPAWQAYRTDISKTLAE